MSSKPRVIKDFEKLDPKIQEQIKLAYPYGFEQNLITFYDKEGKKVMALPFETEDKYYMVRMSLIRAQEIIEDDDDYDEDGVLKENIRESYENKYGDLEHMSDYIGDNSSSEEDDKDPYTDSDDEGEDDGDDEY